MSDRDTKKQLIDLIDQMDEEEQKALLDQLVATKGERRETDRIPFDTSVILEADGSSFSDGIKNISSGGIFIETENTLAIGEAVSVTFSADQNRSITLSGTVAWTGMGGCGIKFNSEFENLLEKLQTEQ